MKKYPKGKGGASRLADKMFIDLALLKNALKIEKNSPELVQVICERFLTISEAIIVQKRPDEYTIVEGELILEKSLENHIDDLRNGKKDTEKIIALWKAKVSLCDLAKKEAIER